MKNGKDLWSILLLLTGIPKVLQNKKIRKRKMTLVYRKYYKVKMVGHNSTINLHVEANVESQVEPESEAIIYRTCIK
jgi:hypothetical protein